MIPAAKKTRRNTKQAKVDKTIAGLTSISDYHLQELNQLLPQKEGDETDEKPSTIITLVNPAHPAYLARQASQQNVQHQGLHLLVQPHTQSIQIQLPQLQYQQLMLQASQPQLQAALSPPSVPPALSLGLEGDKPKKKYKNLIDSDSDDDIGSISIKKKKIDVDTKPIQLEQQRQDQLKQSNLIVIPVAPLNINKCFQDILLQTSKDPNSLTMVRNILSAGSKKLGDKQIIFKKKWNQLRNSNCSHEEYLKWEEQLKRNEAFDIKDIKETTIQRLVNSKIRGLISKEQLLEIGRKEYISRLGLEDDLSILYKEFVLAENQYEEFKSDQFKLLEKLMRENNLVAIDMLRPDMMKQARELSNQVQGSQYLLDDVNNDFELMSIIDGSGKNEAEKQLEFLEDEENSVQRVSLCKYFTKQGDSNELDKNIENYAFQRIFRNYDELTHLSPSDYYLITKRVKSLLLDLKSDELFTDVKFQKEQFLKYQKLLKTIIVIKQQGRVYKALYSFLQLKHNQQKYIT